ncbi:DUF2690 domain-containing protein [Streptomyces sp. NPDC051020]|uniref:helix-turn-helix domain-containing protein n=1 Tax=Streptomyces sp. NPDC051020 TaxID=3155409 RepID=UPI00342A1083
MPRWKALPDELDPQVREFAGQLRRLIDRGGLSVAAVADRTGYSKTSWERYLNGRLLAPKGAIVVLAEVTGTDQAHLATMWELAERAWSRSEMRHDLTMEGIRVAQARAALGEFGPNPLGDHGSRRFGGRTPGTAVAEGEGAGAGGGGRPPSVPIQRGNAPRAPQPEDRPPRPDGVRREPADRRRLTLVLTGVVGALLVLAAAILLTGPGGDDKGGKAAAAPSSASPTTGAPARPAGAECSGADCTGQDPEGMGCGGRSARTVSSATVGGRLVEVRYSRTCGAAWARITDAVRGDTVRITAGGAGRQDGTVDAGADADTPMVAVKKAADAKACATLASGTKGCTTAAGE